MKASIAILSALVLSVVMTRAEEGGNGEGRKKPNPGERFAKVDTDGSGSISLAEFQSTPRGKENPERAAEMFKKIDADSSGDISKDEMMKFAKEHKEGNKGKKRPEGGGEAVAE
jgi:Ca2+-binding EF-hand superfamily protein